MLCIFIKGSLELVYYLLWGICFHRVQKSVNVSESLLIMSEIILEHFSNIIHFSFRMCFDRFPVTAVTFLLLFSGFHSTMSVRTLQSFRGCAVRDFTFVAKKPGCRSLRISTEACWGRCHTWEVTETCYNNLFIELLLLKDWSICLCIYFCMTYLCSCVFWHHRGQFWSRRISRGTTVSALTAVHAT